MADKINATCSICGKGYYQCLSCKDKMKAEPWKQHTDTSEHYKIFQVIKGYNIGVYTKEEACEKLKAIDLSDLESLRDNIKEIIKDIQRAGKKANNVETVVEEPGAEEQEQPVQQVYAGRRKKHPEPVDEGSDI